MRKSSIQIALIYFFLSVIWIFTSDIIFTGFFRNYPVKDQAFFNILKGVGFVSVTSFLLYHLIHNALSEINRAHHENERLIKTLDKVNQQIFFTNPEGKIIWSNNAFCDHKCSSRNEIYGKAYQICFTDNDLYEMILPIMQNSIERREEFRHELLKTYPSGEIKWSHIQGSPIFEDEHHFTGYLIIESDVSDIKNKEVKIGLQSNLLKQSAWISCHEIRKPLASILGLIELMRIAENENELKEYLGLLERCSYELDLAIKRGVEFSERINH